MEAKRLDDFRRSHDEFERRMNVLVPWQQYLQAKWMATVFETFKDIKELWRLADHGSEEEKLRVDERSRTHFTKRSLRGFQAVRCGNHGEF